MSDVPNDLALWPGVWMAGEQMLPGQDWPWPGCRLPGTDYGVLLEIFYNPDVDARRFGTGEFGSDEFGQYTGAAPTVERWVDVTQAATAIQVYRGGQDPHVEVRTDELRFTLKDDSGDIFGWLPPGQLGSPNIGAPIRVSIVNPDGTIISLTLCRIDSVLEIHGGYPVRLLEFVGFGAKTELITGIILPQRPKESVADRIDFALAAINYTDPVAPYPAIFLTRDLSADTHDRDVTESQAFTMINRAANSANYYLWTDRAGTLVWREIANLTPPPVYDWIIADCKGVGETVTAVTMEYAADVTEILNVVQLVNTMIPANNVEAIDTVSVAKWGRHSRGFGFPLLVVNENQTDAQAIADAYLSLSANIINRVKSFTFDTLNDPRWLPFFHDLELSREVLLRRTGPNGVEDFDGQLVGIELNFLPTRVTGICYAQTRNQTF